MPDDHEDPLLRAIMNAENFEPCADTAAVRKPPLLVELAAPDRTISALRDILVNAGGLYDRGVPVRVVYDQILGIHVAHELSPDGLVLLVHQVCRPVVLTEKKGKKVGIDFRFPRQFAVMYLERCGEWGLPPLKGVASAPLLTTDGSIHFREGYDPTSGFWCERVPDLSGVIPLNPTRNDAAAALRRLRQRFATFPFADAAILYRQGIEMVDLSQPPAMDESALLNALVTAVCRPSLRLAPGVLIRAPQMSGAGAGKGLLARCISEVAFGREPHAVAGGSTLEELEKRIAAELIGGSSMLFLDNLNNTAIKSDLLASAITESPARVRILGRSQMAPINPTAFIALTGNGLAVSEDLARRFITVELDPRTEDPEARRFPNDILADVRRDRIQMLADALTIWRWGRQTPDIPEGRPLGSFETWARSVRDPLLALGCRDPAERVAEAKTRDPHRQATAELFRAWWKRHDNSAMRLRDLDPEVKSLIDPQDRGRQFISSKMEKLVGARVPGLILTRQPPPGKWGAATYQMNSFDRDPEVT